MTNKSKGAKKKKKSNKLRIPIPPPTEFHKNKKKYNRKKKHKKEPLTTKVTKINYKYHCRLFYKNEVFNEMVCKEQKDIRFCIKEMLRWYDKCRGDSQMANASRNRNNLNNNKPIGKIWYNNQLKRVKNDNTHVK